MLRAGQAGWPGLAARHRPGDGDRVAGGVAGRPVPLPDGRIAGRRGESGPLRLRAAGQALGRPGPAVVQVGVVLPGRPHAAEQADGGLGHLTVGLAGLQCGAPDRVRGRGRAVGRRHRGVPDGRLGGLEGREHVDADVGDFPEGADRPLPVLGVHDGRVEAPADAADRFGGGGEQEVALDPVQRGGRVLALAEQGGRGGLEGGDGHPPGLVQARLREDRSPGTPASTRNIAGTDPARADTTTMPATCAAMTYQQRPYSRQPRWVKWARTGPSADDQRPSLSAAAIVPVIDPAASNGSQRPAAPHPVPGREQGSGRQAAGQERTRVQDAAELGVHHARLGRSQAQATELPGHGQPGQAQLATSRACSSGL